MSGWWQGEREEGSRRRADLSAAVAAWVRPQQRAAFSSWLLATRAAGETRGVVAAVVHRWQRLALSDALRSWQVGAFGVQQELAIVGYLGDSHSNLRCISIQSITYQSEAIVYIRRQNAVNMAVMKIGSASTYGVDQGWNEASN